MALRPGRYLTSEEKEFFLGLKPEDITKTFLQSIFSDTYDMKEGKIVQSKYNTYDQFVLNAGEYYNKEKITTNCGLFIFNKRVLEQNYLSKIGYQNTELSNGQVKKLNTMLSEMGSQNEEEFDKYIRFLNDELWLADSFHSEICSSMSLKSAKPIPAVEKRKAELLNKHSKEISEGNIDVVTNITNELLDIARNELKDDPSYELYESGARGSFDNAYRRMQVMVGPVYNAAREKYDIVTNSLYDGYSKEDIRTMANSVVSSQYVKAVGTGVSGYMTKKINASFQGVVLDEKGSDCGTKNTAKITLDKDMISLYMYCYMVEGSKLVQLTPENQNKYKGKTVNMRVASLCRGTKPCNICSGDKIYIIGIKNVGLTINRISSTFLNAGMKNAHDSTVRIQHLSVDEMIV